MIFLIFQPRHGVQQLRLTRQRLFPQGRQPGHDLLVAQVPGMNLVGRGLAEAARLVGQHPVGALLQALRQCLGQRNQTLFDFLRNGRRILLGQIIVAVFGIAPAVVHLHHHALTAEHGALGHGNAAAGHAIAFAAAVRQQNGNVSVFFQQPVQQLPGGLLFLCNVSAVLYLLHMQLSSFFPAGAHTQCRSGRFVSILLLSATNVNEKHLFRL